MVSLRAEWIQLREAVEKIELQIESTGALIPTDLMCKLLIAGEDHRFHLHPGVDPVALL